MLAMKPPSNARLLSRWSMIERPFLTKHLLSMSWAKAAPVSAGGSPGLRGTLEACMEAEASALQQVGCPLSCVLGARGFVRRFRS